jgi:hypothetical protein
MGNDKIQKILLKPVNVTKFNIFLMYEKFTDIDIKTNWIKCRNFVKGRLEKVYTWLLCPSAGKNHQKYIII